MEVVTEVVIAVVTEVVTEVVTKEVTEEVMVVVTEVTKAVTEEVTEEVGSLNQSSIILVSIKCNRAELAEFALTTFRRRLRTSRWIWP